MSKHDRYERARHNAERVKGFVCPTCDSLVPRGYEICYNCGEDALLGSSSASSESYVATSCFAYVSALIAPIFYLMSIVSLEPISNLFNFLIVLPNIIILTMSLVSVIKWRTSLGWFFGPMHIWILIFSIQTFIKNIQFYIA